MKPIQIWRFDDAPEELQQLSDHCGDEDWLALVPAEYGVGYEDNIPWITWMDPDILGPFGCSGISIHKLPDGSHVRIGAHS